MKFRHACLCALSAALIAIPAMAAEAPYHRVELKPPPGSALPYNGALPFTLEVPAGWEVRQFDNFPGLWISPADAKPPDDPRHVWVRGSKISIADPAQLVANIKANDAIHPEWSAPRVEAMTVGGLKCVLVQMETTGDKAGSSLTLKVPFQTVSVDLVTSATRTEFPKLQAMFERILLSVQPVVPGKK